LGKNLSVWRAENPFLEKPVPLVFGIDEGGCYPCLSIPPQHTKYFNDTSMPMELHCGKYRLSLAHPLIMGIVNVTPDSFSDGVKYHDALRAIEHGRQLIVDGADILDIGGESSRPGAEPVTEEMELRRVLPVIEALSTAGVPLSVRSSPR